MCNFFYYKNALTSKQKLVSYEIWSRYYFAAMMDENSIAL